MLEIFFNCVRLKDQTDELVTVSSLFSATLAAAIRLPATNFHAIPGQSTRSLSCTCTQFYLSLCPELSTLLQICSQYPHKLSVYCCIL